MGRLFGYLFTNNPYISALTFVMSVLSLYYAVRPLHISRFSYFKITNKVIDLKSSNINLLYMKYKDELITDVSITEIALWNSGTEDLYEERIVEESPLVLGVKEGSDAQLLDCRVKYRTDSSNKIQPYVSYGDTDDESVTHSKKKYKISFEYIPKKDGVVLEVIHTGDADDLYMDCHIKGGEDIVEIDKQGVAIKKNSNNKIVDKAVGVFRASALFFSDDPNNPISVYQGFFIFCYTIVGVVGCIFIFLSSPQFQAYAEFITPIETIFADFALLVWVSSILFLLFARKWWLFIIPRKLVRHL